MLLIFMNYDFHLCHMTIIIIENSKTITIITNNKKGAIAHSEFECKMGWVDAFLSTLPNTCS